MIRVPKQSAVIGRTVFPRVVNIDVDDVSRQITHEIVPAPVTAAEILHQGAINGVVLIVVVRDEWEGAVVADRFMIGVEVSEMAPAILIDGLAPLEERV